MHPKHSNMLRKQLFCKPFPRWQRNNFLMNQFFFSYCVHCRSEMYSIGLTEVQLQTKSFVYWQHTSILTNLQLVSWQRAVLLLEWILFGLLGAFWMVPTLWVLGNSLCEAAKQTEALMIEATDLSYLQVNDYHSG